MAMRLAVLCLALTTGIAACSYNPHGGSGRTTLVCLHRDKDVCLSLTSINSGVTGPKGDAAIPRASQVELDTSAIWSGMYEPRRGSDLPADPDQIE